LLESRLLWLLYRPWLLLKGWLLLLKGWLLWLLLKGWLLRLLLEGWLLCWLRVELLRWLLWLWVLFGRQNRFLGGLRLGLLRPDHDFKK
jgi:hypothetical protein